MDTPQSHRDLSALYNERSQKRNVEIQSYNSVEDAIINGTLPEGLRGLFTPSDIRIQLRTLRSADESLFKLLREIPVLPRADVLKETDKARNAAELVEKIVFGYFNGTAQRGGAEFTSILAQLATDQVRFSDGLLLAHFDTKRKLVFLEAKDPRCFYGPTGWHPGSIVPLDGGLLVYEMPLGEMKQRFAYDSYGDTIPDVMGRLNNAYGRNNGAEADDKMMVKLGVYRSREAWYIAALADNDVVLYESETGDKGHPGVCGMASFKQYRRGPIFEGQMGIEAAAEKVINQSIQNTERINKATTYGPPLLNDTKVVGGYNEINYAVLAGRSAQFYREAPDSPGGGLQLLGSLLSLAGQFNYNPESMSGGGQQVSGKAINAAQAGPRTLVTNVLWSPYEVAFPRLIDDCMEGELNLWPNERKTSHGRNGRQSYETDYTPSAALEGYKGRVKIEEPRLGGYNAFLEAVQKRDAGLLDLRSTLEKDPDVRDVEETIRRIDSEATEKFIAAGFEALGGQDPLLAIKAATRVNELIGKGSSKAEAIAKVIEEGMLEPPAPPEMADPMAGGLPPGMAEMLGGGMGEEMPVPSLAEARGF